MNRRVFTINEVKRKLESFCVYQDRSHKEIEKKLTEYHLIPEAKETILMHLLQNDFLNEERFSKSFARGKFRIKKWGKQRIIRELKYRGVLDYNIKIALKEIDNQEYISTIYKLIENKNKLISETNKYKRKKKIINYLLYKGFETNFIYTAVNKIIT